jgi:hypothetical protein
MHREKTCEYNIQQTEEKSRAWQENGNIPLMRHIAFPVGVVTYLFHLFNKYIDGLLHHRKHDIHRSNWGNRISTHSGIMDVLQRR